MTRTLLSACRMSASLSVLRDWTSEDDSWLRNERQFSRVQGEEGKHKLPAEQPGATLLCKLPRQCLPEGAQRLQALHTGAEGRCARL